MKITRTAAVGVLAALALAAAGCSSADSAKPATATTTASSSRSSAAASSARAAATGTAPVPLATYKPWNDPSSGSPTCTYVHPESGGFEVALLVQGTLQYPNDPAVCYSALNEELAKYDQGAGDTLPGIWTYQPGAAPQTGGGCNGTVGDVTVTIGLAGSAAGNENEISEPGYPQAENDSSSYCGSILNPYG